MRWIGIIACGIVQVQVQIALIVVVLVAMLGLACSGQTAMPPPASVALEPPAVPTVAPTVAAESANTVPQDMLDRAQSDDAISIEEAHFHSQARATVIFHVEPNKLKVGGREFRVKRNPVLPGGAFVYDPRTRFYGVERKLVWWVPGGDIAELTAYPLNGPSKMVTPGLEFPVRAGVAIAPDTSSVAAYVFDGIPIATSASTPSPVPTARPASTAQGGVESLPSLRKMEIAFDGNPRASQIRPILDNALLLYGVPITEENYSRAGSTLVALRKELGPSEMDILDHMIRSYVSGVNISFPDMAALCAVGLAEG